LEREATGNLNEKEMTYLRFIREGSKRMQDLIQDLLEYSRVETRVKDFAKVDMNDVVKKALHSLEYSIKESQAKVTVDVLPTIFGDQTQMVQLIQNLMGNALKFRRPGEPPRLEVSSVTNQKEHVFSVRDNGIGIAPEHADMLFKMFSRLHTNDEYPGTGIGLAVAKKIVERHGGRIWVESDGISGSIFSFSIPIAT
jgi:light-regulated signal transduction histidine kinase (bacteriophytochrome)